MFWRKKSYSKNSTLEYICPSKISFADFHDGFHTKHKIFEKIFALIFQSSHI